MSERDKLAHVIHGAPARVAWNGEQRLIADAVRASGYRKPRTITTAEHLEGLPFGSAVQTSDESDTVVLKDKGAFFRNQSGYELSATTLWRFGTRPFTVLYEPTA